MRLISRLTPLLCAVLAACQQNAVPLPSSAPPAPVEQITGEVAQSVTALHLEVGGEVLARATVTPPAPGAGGTPSPGAPSSFVLPLPDRLPGAALSRFASLFGGAGCRRILESGNELARIHAVTLLHSAAVPFSARQSGPEGAAQTLYLYSDRATALHGSLECERGAVTPPARFDLNLVRGWNRLQVTVPTAPNPSALRQYVTFPRIAGKGERWSALE